MRDEIIENVKERGRTVSLSAWLSTSIVTIGIVAMVLLGVESKDSLDLVFFVLMLVSQGIITTTWLPEGKQFGETKPLFMQTRSAYNGKVNDVISRQISMELKDYCDYDFEVRKKHYKMRMLARAALDFNDLDKVAEMQENEFYDKFLFWKKFKAWDKKKVGEDEISLNKLQVRVLYTLIFKPLPIQANNVETIIGGATVSEVNPVKDTTSKYINKWLGGKFGILIVMSLITAYLGLRLAQGITLQAILQAIMLIMAVVTSLTSSFLTGERAITIHKRSYYVDASNFIDRFFEWHNKKVKKEIEDNGRINDPAESLGE